MRAYGKILLEDLQVLRGQIQVFYKEHKKDIHKKFIFAGREMQKGKPDAFTINQCLHIASSVLLLGGSPEELDKLSNAIHNHGDFSHNDPTTVATITTLYYLIKTDENHDMEKEERDAIKHIHKRFDEINWLIGVEGMKALGIETLKE
jgi:hypothetical protein